MWQTIIQFIQKHKKTIYHLLMMFLSVCPALVGYCVTGSVLWVEIALFSASVYCIQRKRCVAFLPQVIHSVFTFGFIIILYQIKTDIFQFSLLAASVTAIFMALIFFGKSYRALCNWTVIPSVYIVCELKKNVVSGFSIEEIIRYTLIGYSGNVLIMLIHLFEEKKEWISVLLWRPLPRAFERDRKYLFFAPGVFFVVFISSLVVKGFGIHEGQWLIWSSLSVFTGEVNSMVKKLKQRTIYGASGLLAGYFIASLFLAGNAKNMMLAFFIPLTLVLPCYEIAFGSRNMLIAVSSNSIAIGVFRVSNILMGGFIGVAGGFLIIKSYEAIESRLASRRYKITGHT